MYCCAKTTQCKDYHPVCARAEGLFMGEANIDTESDFHFFLMLCPEHAPTADTKVGRRDQAYYTHFPGVCVG